MPQRQGRDGPSKVVSLPWGLGTVWQGCKTGAVGEGFASNWESGLQVPVGRDIGRAGPHSPLF